MSRSRRHSILGRFALVSLVALVVASGASLLLSSSYNSKDVIRQSKKVVDKVAQETQATLNGMTYEQLIAVPRTSEHEEARETFQNRCFMLNIRFLYVYELNDDQVATHYLFAIAGEKSEDDAFRRRVAEAQAAREDPLNHGFPQELQARSGTADPEPLVTETPLGKDLTWYYPLSVAGHDKPLVLRIDVDDDLITDRIFDNTLSFAIPMIAINALVVLLEVTLLRQSVSNPLGVVSERMRAFVRNDSTDAEPLEIGRNDEIAEIASSYNKMTSDISRYVDQIETMTQERVAAQTELSVAQRIQQGLVPPTTELAGPGFEAFAFMRMARAVGGDFYDLLELKDGRVLVMLADVSGKGMSAALFMAMSRTLLLDRLQTCLDPAQALNEANDIIASNNPECMFVTLIAGIFEPSSGVLTYANAGHTPPLVIGRDYQSPEPGMALGPFEDVGIVNETIRLNPGEGVLLYTDGATEATNADDSFFGEERLVDAVEGTSRPTDAIRAAVDAIDVFVAGCEQFDDLTFLSLFSRKAEDATTETLWRATLKAETSSLEELPQHVLPCFETRGRGMNAMVACDEIFTNIATYSGATAVDVEIERTGDEIVIRFSDDGTPFDPLAAKPIERSFEDLDMGGMGIALVKKICSDLAYENVEGRNVLTLHFER